MPHPSVEAAVRARLSGGWDGVVADSVAPSEPPAGLAKYAVIDYPVVTGSRPFLQRRYFEEGVARIRVHMVSTTALAAVLQEAEVVASLFRSREVAGGLTTFAPSNPRLLDGASVGNWIQVQVMVPYRYQFDG